MGDDVAEFKSQDQIINSNIQYYQNNPHPDPHQLHLVDRGAAPVSDESGTQLKDVQEAHNVCPEVDHIIAFSDWGSNDPRNARVVNYRENRASGTTRTNQFRIVALENDPYLPVNQGDVLTVAQVNQLLQREDRAAVGQMNQLTDEMISTIYDSDREREKPTRKRMKKASGGRPKQS